MIAIDQGGGKRRAYDTGDLLSSRARGHKVLFP